RDRGRGLLPPARVPAEVLPGHGVCRPSPPGGARLPRGPLAAGPSGVESEELGANRFRREQLLRPPRSTGGSLRNAAAGAWERSHDRPQTSAARQDIGRFLMKVAVIGVGHMGYHHVRVYAEMETVELVAVADPDEAAARKATHSYRLNRYADY